MPRKTLPVLERRLFRTDRRQIFANAEWVSDVPHRAGVYAIWDRRKQEVIYIGETSDLRLRFNDLRRAVNHTFTKKMRAYLKLGRRASDIRVRKAMSASFELAFLPVPLGRAELEEYLVLRHRTTLINKPARRLIKGSQYAWIRPAR